MLCFAVISSAVVYPTAPSVVLDDNNYTTSIAVANLDGDDDMDIIAGNYRYPYTSETTLSNPGTWSSSDFGDTLMIYWNGATTPTALISTPSLGRLGVDKVEIMDFNNDGLQDILLGCVTLAGNDGANILLINDGDQTFTVEDAYNPDPGDTHDIAAGDINNDGICDIVSIGVLGDLQIWLSGASDMTLSNLGQVLWPDYELAMDAQFPGRVVELGDIDNDGDLDLFTDYNRCPRIYKNTGTGDFFDPNQYYVVRGDTLAENTDCAAFGWVEYNGGKKLGLAIGTKHPLNRYDGNVNVFVLDSGYLKKVMFGIPDDLRECPLISDLQWGDVDDDSSGMEIVTGAYPRLGVSGSSLAWEDGYCQYYSVPTIADFNDTLEVNEVWNASNTDLTLSIALGDMNGDGLDTTEQILTFNSTGKKLAYLNHFPIHKILSVKHIENGLKYTIDSDSFCYHLKNGWISIDSTLTYDSVAVKYSYSTALDLVVGNDGYNKIFYHGGSSTTNTPPTPFVCSSMPSQTYTAVPAPTYSLMDTSGAIGIPAILDKNGRDSQIAQIPDVNAAALWFFWNDVEEYRGHYYWHALDELVNDYIDNGTKLALFADGSCSQKWVFPYDTSSTALDYPRDPKYSAYFMRNLVNRYRTDGVLNLDAGVSIYGFDNEPGGGFGGKAYSRAPEILRYILRYNYGMIHTIDDDLTYFSPNFANPQEVIDEASPSADSISFIDVPMVNLFYDDSDSGVTANDHALLKYTDVICHQLYTFADVGVASDPYQNNYLELMLDTLVAVTEAAGDSGKPFMAVEWTFIPWLGEDTLTTEEKNNWSVSQIAEMFACKRFKWNFSGMCDNSVTNLQAQILNGCRYYVPQFYATPDTTIIPAEEFSLEDEGHLFGHRFEQRRNTPNTYVLQVRTDSGVCDETVRISTIETDSSSMDGYQAEIVDIVGDSWDRAYGVFDSDSVYVKFYPSEIDSTPLWIKEVYNNTTSNVSIDCSLPSGLWRLISFNIEPGDPDIDVVFDGVGQDLIHDYRDWEWNATDPDFTTWEVEQGFNVHIPSSHASSSVNVTESDLFGPDSEIDITPYVAPDTLRHDYNRFFISYLPQVSLPVDIAFKDLIGLGNNGDDTLVYWIRNTIGQFYMPSQPGHSVKFLCHPGEGYDLNMTSDSTVHNFNFSNTTFTPDVWNGGGKDFSGEDQISSFTPNHFEYRICTQDIYPIVIDALIVEGVTIEAGDELGVFTSDDVCCGAQILTLNQTGFILTAWEDDIATEEKDGFEWGETMTFKFYDASLDTEYVIEGSPYTIYSAGNQTQLPAADVSGGFGAGQYAIRSLVFDGPAAAIPNSYALRQNYPNPFNPVTAIQYDLPYQSKVTLEIFNVLGQRVAVLVDGIQPAGYKKVIWSGNEFSSGVYVCKFHAESLQNGESHDSLKKMILVK